MSVRAAFANNRAKTIDCGDTYLIDAPVTTAELRRRRRRHFSACDNPEMLLPEKQLKPESDEQESTSADKCLQIFGDFPTDERFGGVNEHIPSPAMSNDLGRINETPKSDFLTTDFAGGNEHREKAVDVFKDNREDGTMLNQISSLNHNDVASEMVRMKTVPPDSKGFEEVKLTSNGAVAIGDYHIGDIEREPLLDDDENSVDDSAPSSNEVKVVKSPKKEKRTNETGEAPKTERAWAIALQVSFPFFIAGCGTVGAGLVLDIVQHHEVFVKVPQIYILVPALLGLKGNLEMTLASRLSTLANLGRIDSRKEKIKQIVGNLALIQAQAAVVSFLAAIFAIVLGWVPKGEFRFDHALLLCASSLATGSLASFILGSLMIFVVLMARKLHVNPDNIATPIAASLGDLTTLALFAAAGTLLINTNFGNYLSIAIITLFISLCPLWFWLSARTPSTRAVLISGWSPVIFSMLISSAGGFILEHTVTKFKGIAVFQPVINGIGGNLVAVQASRISTTLHRESRLGVLPPTAPSGCFNPCETFFGKQADAAAARVLLSLVIPGHLVFMSMIKFLSAGHTSISPLLVVVYCSAALIQVVILLYVCLLMVYAMWRRKVDPDNSAIPYLTALGDLLGTALLAAAFYILYAVGDQDAN